MGEIEMDGLFSRDDPERPADSQGFSAAMSGLSLFDFVQMECLAGTRRAIRVTSGSRIGYLFFADGSVTHALTPDTFGETAALQILRWRDGRLEQCKLHPDERARIQRPWQRLLLEAAQAEDESTHDNLVEFPRRSTLPRPPEQQDTEELAPQSTTKRDGVLGAARLQASGEVLSIRGESDALPGLAAYALRLGELIGASLGIEQLLTLDARFGRTRCAIKREASGALVIARALTQDPTPAIEALPRGHAAARSQDTLLVLAGLKDVEGVLGSFVIGAAGDPLWFDLPKVFQSQAIAEVGARLVRLTESFETLGERLRALELRYAQYRLHVRVCDRVLLVVACGAACPPALLTLAVSVVGRQLASMGQNPSLPSGASLAPISSSSDRSASAPSQRAGRTMAAPGAPSATSGVPSNRPVFFRGRRVQ